MLSLGIPEFLILLTAILMAYGSWRIPKLIRSADEARRSFQTGTRLPADQPFEPVGLTLRQIQFRGSVTVPEWPAVTALQGESDYEVEADADDEPDTEPEAVGDRTPALTFSGARRVPASRGPVDSAGIDGWEDIYI